jgi:predicted adenylyl cyclase CyaB
LSDMKRNIEIKARIDNIEGLAAKVRELADKGPVELFQDDTFFHCSSGRLKLRTLSSTEGQLIFYNRPDQAGPKESAYLISPTASPDTLREVLSRAYGETGRVRKQRTLFLIGRTRVHLDQVEGLGCFLELEVVLGEGEPSGNGESEALDLLGKLGISSSQLVEKAYVDLLKSSSK